MNIRTLVVVPAFNEEKSIGAVLAGILRSGLDVVVVDDGSTDATSEVAKSHGVQVIRLTTNQGVGGALRCGFRWAVENQFGAVVQVDADGQHDPDQIQDLITAASNSTADLVIGSRFYQSGKTESVGKGRRLIMKLMAASVSRFLDSPVTDVTSGFRVVSGELLVHLSRNLPNYYLGDTYEVAYVAARRGYEVVEIPIKMNRRQFGVSSASRGVAISLIAKTLIVTLLGLHFELPEKR